MDTRLPKSGIRGDEALADAYRAARGDVALFDRSHRGRLVVRGADRKAWLHNLVTNAVTSLEDGRGCYAFAVDPKGRVLFDMNVLCMPGELWLDVELGFAGDLAAYLERYRFTEEVRVEDVGGGDARLGCGGPRAAEVAEAVGIPGLVDLPQLAMVELAVSGQLVRHDFAGLLGFELIVPRAEGEVWQERLVAAGARPAALAVLDALRIEAGIPWLGRDLDADVLPPETGAGIRGVAWNKGCYVGHEILERIRSRGVLARSLARVSMADGSGAAVPCELRHNDRVVGRLTSLVRHPVRPEWVGLAYLKTSVTDAVGIRAGGEEVEVHESSIVHLQRG